MSTPTTAQAPTSATAPPTAAPASTAQALCLARWTLAHCLGPGATAPSEEGLRALLRELGAPESSVTEARRCWRLALAEAPWLGSAPEAALERHFGAFGRLGMESLLTAAAALAALRSLHRLLPQREPEGARLTWARVHGFLVEECGADAQAMASVELLFNRTRPEGGGWVYLLSARWVEWFEGLGREEALGLIARGAALGDEEVRP